MSLTLGEKLRQAREEHGFTISEVAEQTRISSLYLQSIENDDYRTLPGGIFNKGFVKSYAKFVGVDEQEALLDYSQLISDSTNTEESELRRYRPEVLTDDNSAASMTPTIILAVVILGLMTAGILFLVSYLRQPAAPIANATPKTNVNAPVETPANTETVPPGVPDMATLKVDFKALTQPIKVIATVDGQPPQPNSINSGSSMTFTPKESLTLNYLRWNAPAVEMTINGKTIKLPQSPLEAKDRDRIVFTISKENLAQIWTNGAISPEIPAATTATNSNVSTTPVTNVTTTVPTPVRPTPVPKPSTAGDNTAAPEPKPRATVRTTPTPKPTIIVIPPAKPANRPQ